MSPRALSPPPSYFLKAVTAWLSDLLCFSVLVMETNSCISLHWAPALFAGLGEIISTRIFLHSSGKGWRIICALYAFVISWTFFAVGHSRRVPSSIYAHIFAQITQCGSNLARVTVAEKSSWHRPSSQMVHCELWICWHEYTGGDCKPRGARSREHTTSAQTTKNWNNHI